MKRAGKRRGGQRKNKLQQMQYNADFRGSRAGKHTGIILSKTKKIP